MKKATCTMLFLAVTFLGLFCDAVEDQNADTSKASLMTCEQEEFLGHFTHRFEKHYRNVIRKDLGLPEQPQNENANGVKLNETQEAVLVKITHMVKHSYRNLYNELHPDLNNRCDNQTTPNSVPNPTEAISSKLLPKITLKKKPTLLKLREGTTEANVVIVDEAPSLSQAVLKNRTYCENNEPRCYFQKIHQTQNCCSSDSGVGGPVSDDVCGGKDHFCKLEPQPSVAVGCRGSCYICVCEAQVGVATTA